jgi:hypothetical protein
MSLNRRGLRSRTVNAVRNGDAFMGRNLALRISQMFGGCWRGCWERGSARLSFLRRFMAFVVEIDGGMSNRAANKIGRHG